MKRLYSIYSITLFMQLFSIHTLVSWLPPLTVYDEELFTEKKETVAFNAPTSFGKTHFIFGYNEQPEKVEENTPRKKDILLCDDNGRVCSVYFSPDEKLYDTLIALIKREKKRICIAAYMLTNASIAHALCDAYQRGISIEVVTDPHCVRDKSNKLALLDERGISVHVYKPTKCRGIIGSLMHNKFVLFEDNIYGASLVWTGSANLTRSSEELNQENVMIVNDVSACDAYKKQFALLKERSELYKDSHVSNAELQERLYKMEAKK